MLVAHSKSSQPSILLANGHVQDCQLVNQPMWVWGFMRVMVLAGDEQCSRVLPEMAPQGVKWYYGDSPCGDMKVL
ncbi:hypothetical protein Tco_0478766 [Tanacetum coccineum]